MCSGPWVVVCCRSDDLLHVAHVHLSLLCSCVFFEGTLVFLRFPEDIHIFFFLYSTWLALPSPTVQWFLGLWVAVVTSFRTLRAYIYYTNAFVIFPSSWILGRN